VIGCFPAAAPGFRPMPAFSWACKHSHAPDGLMRSIEAFWTKVMPLHAPWFRGEFAIIMGSEATKPRVSGVSYRR
jgi:hypothetical protein